MNLDSNCLKCDSSNYILKNVYLPEKDNKKVSFDMGLYYFKICLECGYTEMYSAKIVDGNEEPNFCY